MISRISSLTRRKQVKQQNRKSVTFFPPPGRDSLHQDPDAFLRAAISNDILAMRNLIAAGFNPNCSLGEDPVLLLCAKMGYTDAVAVILQFGPCDDIMDGDGMTALHHAAKGGYAEIVQLFLHAGAYVDSRVHSQTDLYYMTPLILACMHNRHTAAAVLLERKASVHATDYLGRTALHHACARSDTSILIYQLLAAGANAELPDSGGTTPLMYAAMALNLRVVKALMVWGADVEVKGSVEGHRDAVYRTKRDKRGSIVTLVDAGGRREEGVGSGQIQRRSTQW